MSFLSFSVSFDHDKLFFPMKEYTMTKSKNELAFVRRFPCGVTDYLTCNKLRNALCISVPSLTGLTLH